MRGLEINLVIPDLWQQNAVHALRDGRDVVVHAPTGAGKTFIFELLYPNLKGQAIYTVPTRALANDKLAEWQRKGWDVGIATGDVAYRLDARVVVATLETQKARFVRREGPQLLVVDEYQMIADLNRGVNYELAIATAPPGTQLLLLSGSVANPKEVVAWLHRIGRDALLVSHDERPVPLEEVELTSLGGSFAGGARGFWPSLIQRALRADLGPVLVFAPRRNAAEQLATSFATPHRDPLVLTPEQELLAGNALTKLLRNRVAYHHSGLSYGVRAGLIEPLAKNGQLDVVVATMGLAAGINFSMRSVLVTDTRYLAGHIEKHVQPDELLQMFGRAGRRGMDEIGYVLTTPDHPRLADGRAKQLRRAGPVDWPTLIAIMRGAVDRGAEPFQAAQELNSRLFTSQPVPLGTEHSRETGAMPCGLWVDMERARFARRALIEMQNSKGEWEPLSLPEKAPIADALVHRGDRWLPAAREAKLFEKIGSGSLCRITTDRGWIYGREFPIATILEQKPGKKPHPGELLLAKWLAKACGQKYVTQDQFESAVVPILPELVEGRLIEAFERGHQIVGRTDVSAALIEVHRDQHGKLLVSPPQREAIPIPCRECPERETYCRKVEIIHTPAHAWRILGLVDPDGKPTRRGVVFSFFNSGEGLAIAVALEETPYPIPDIIFDLANLRASHRFAGDDSPYGGRLGILCQQRFGRADYPGYLEMGVPVNHGAGASEVVRAITEHGVPKHKLLTESLRIGDIERALIEWRSLLRLISLGPDYEWDRWWELKREAARHAEFTAPTDITRLPMLTAAQSRRRPSG